MILVTGGAGFIGANFVLDWLAQSDEPIVNLDALTYAGNLENLARLRDATRAVIPSPSGGGLGWGLPQAPHSGIAPLLTSPQEGEGLQRAPTERGGTNRHHFVHGDICNRPLLDQLLAQHQPRAILHFAAESHVDRSIHGPAEFIRTNIEGTFTLLEAARGYWSGLRGAAKENFRFLQVSTDEVYGSLALNDAPFSEATPYQPNSPYSASKASADHLVRAWHHTYGLPVLTTNCSNNYGPYQFPEKLIPLMIINALAGKNLPIYGDGKNIRDWLYVADHCAAIRTVLAQGMPGETYAIGGGCEKTNLEIVHTICRLLDDAVPRASGSYTALISHVPDRPGHDRRYAIDARKIERALGWKPAETFESGMQKTIRWYLDHPQWIANVQTGAYRDWVSEQYEGKDSETRTPSFPEFSKGKF